jgi:hypothetical protein
MRSIGMSFARPSNKLIKPTRSKKKFAHCSLGNFYLD